MCNRFLISAAAMVIAVACVQNPSTTKSVDLEYQFHQMNKELSTGWNSYDARSLFTEVYLPECFGVKIALEDSMGDFVEDLRVGNKRDWYRAPQAWKDDAATVHPYGHAYDNSYSEVDAEWHGVSVKLRCASDGDDLVMLLTPGEDCADGSKVHVTPCLNWDCISLINGGDVVRLKDKEFTFIRRGNDWEITGHVVADNVTAGNAFYTCDLSSAVLVTVGKEYTIEEAEALMQKNKSAMEHLAKGKYGEHYDAYNACQSILAWDTIYEPSEEIIISPVSRNWSVRWATVPDFGGYVLFDWDTFFASQMLASTGARELAYSNVHQVLSSVDQVGFVPKFTADHKNITADCSQPPVGSMSVWRIYEKYGEKWFLELCYPRLMKWNRWWPEDRQTDGLLCWGSNPVREHLGERGEGSRVHAILESGLDNSHMYDEAGYNPDNHQLTMQDVGLTSLYVMDCDYLAKIAGELGYRKDVKELKSRADLFRKNLQQLWCEEDGMFYNRFTDTGEYNKRISPTNFYVFLANAASREQADRMINDHLLNEDEFWGEWVIPNAPKNDPAYQDQNYWRGRIWGPTNYLTYMGLRNYADKEVTQAFADKSEALLLKGWLSKGYIYENWNAITGDSEFRDNSDTFYHWGALLGYISLIETYGDKL